MTLLVQTAARGHASLRSRQPSQTVTIVVCTRHRPALLQKCLAAIAKLNPGPHQVLVVDNSEGNSDTRKVAQDYDARYVIEPIRGLSRARNRGLAECDSDIVVYLDDDAIPAPDWLGLLLAPFADEMTGASTGRVITPESGSNHEESPRSLSNQEPRWFEMATFGGMGLGSNMAVRKQACTGPCFFDERLGRGAPFEIGEENYAFASLLSRGYKVVYLPAAVVFHPSFSRSSIEHEARNSITYCLLLFIEFPEQRMNLLRFILRRLRRKPLEWSREPQEPGEIVTSGWRVLFKASVKALWLFLRTPKGAKE